MKSLIVIVALCVYIAYQASRTNMLEKRFENFQDFVNLQFEGQQRFDNQSTKVIRLLSDAMKKCGCKP